MILSSTIITKFKKQRNPKEFEDASGYISVSTVSTYLRLMAITSLFMPCMMVNSQWPLLNHLAITSGTIICLILSILMLISHQDPSLLSSNMMADPVLYRTVCGIVIGLIAFGCIITAAQFWLAKWRHQTYLFNCVLGNKEAVEKMLLSRDTKEHNFTEVNCEQRTGLDFAIEMGHSEIVQLIKQHGEACGIPPPDNEPNFYRTY